MRVAGLLFLVAALTGLVPSTAYTQTRRTGAWVKAPSLKDEMTDQRVIRFALRAREAVSGWLSTARPTLHAMCSRGHFEMYLETDLVLAPIHDDDGYFTARIRLDNAPARPWYWKDGADVGVMFASDPRALAALVVPARTLRVEIRPHNSSRAIVTFDVAGLAAVLAQVSPACEMVVSPTGTLTRQ